MTRRDIREQLAQALAREHGITTAHLPIGELVELTLEYGLPARVGVADRATKSPTDERNA